MRESESIARVCNFAAFEDLHMLNHVSPVRRVFVALPVPIQPSRHKLLLSIIG